MRDCADASNRPHRGHLRPVGAAGLIYEIVWSRQLVLVFGNTTQAVSAILTGFFGGMAIGAFFGGRIADRVRSPLRMYGILELLLGRRARHAAVVPTDPRGILVDLAIEGTPMLVIVRLALAVLAGASDGDDGRHIPGAGPPFRPR